LGSEWEAVEERGREQRRGNGKQEMADDFIVLAVGSARGWWNKGGRVGRLIIYQGERVDGTRRE
jgi:hypothetical protein